MWSMNISPRDGPLQVQPVWCMKTQSQVGKETPEGEAPVS